MEDYIVLKSETETKGQAFFAVFDGQGGKEAAKYARNNLWQAIKDSEGFYSGDLVKVAQAIAAGFVKTHEDMWKVRDSWKKTKGGDPSPQYIRDNSCVCYCATRSNVHCKCW